MKSRPSYPWLDLYNLESRPEARQQRPQRRRGRPPRPVKRTKKMVELTDEELRILNSIQGSLKRRLSSVSRGQVIGLALRRLEQELFANAGKPIALPEGIQDWHGLVAILEGERI